MPECLLVYAGQDLDVDGLLQCCGCTPAASWRRGDPGPTRKSAPRESSCVKLLVSSGDDMRDKINDAVEFLRGNRDTLVRLASIAGIESAHLDFAWHFNGDRMPAQFATLPLELLQACASLGLEIGISVYAVGTSEQ